jgi:putative ABC transport system substrate-binding protein
MEADMRRRDFIKVLSGAAAWPLAARAQTLISPTIGFLSSRSSDVDASLVTAFHQGLAANGFIDGRNVAIEFRWARGRYEQLPKLAAELVSKPVAVLVSTGGTVSARAAKASTTTTPVVFTTADDPVAVGLVDSLNRPGGNVTGITASFIETAPKRLELLRELLPKASKIGFLVNPDNPATLTESSVVRPAAAAMGQHIEILRAKAPQDIDRVFDSLKSLQLDAMLLAVDPFFFARARQIVTLAAREAIPTLYFRREFVAMGGLMSQGSNFAKLFRVVGDYAGRILKGAKPGELPVQQPTQFEVAINLKTTNALGITVPPTLLARADEVIE